MSANLIIKVDQEPNVGAINSGTPEVWKLVQFPEVFCDGVATDESGFLLFASLYGREASVRQLLAALHLGESGGGSDRIVVLQQNREWRATVRDARELRKIQTKIPTRFYGDLMQVQVFDKRVCEPDHANRKAYLLSKRDSGQRPDELWQLVCQLSHVALLAHWQPEIMQRVAGILRHGFSTAMEAIGRVTIDCVQVPTDFEAQVSGLIRRGVLKPHP